MVTDRMEVTGQLHQVYPSRNSRAGRDTLRVNNNIGPILDILGGKGTEGKVKGKLKLVYT